ncbi:MAG: hypothetical protein H6648_06355 [Caldilineae bacterium]|nr:hypothetical protein [Caldilineae bacterium]
MNPKSTRTPGPVQALGLGRALLLVGLLLAMTATLGPLMTGGSDPVAHAQAGLGPVEGKGRWISFANGDRVNRILRDGTVAWAATEGGGLVRWDLRSGEYRQFLAPQDGLASNDVQDIERMPDGTLWLATPAGLSRLDPGADRLVTLTPENTPGMLSRVVTALEPTTDGQLWVGFAQEWDRQLLNRFTNEPGAFRSGGLARFDPATGTWPASFLLEFAGERNQEKYKSIPSENITDLEYASDGLLWVGTRPYYAWDDTACFDNTGCKGFWVLRGGGLAAHDGSAWTQFAALDGTGGCFSNHILDLEADVDGRMWAATSGDGVLLMLYGMRKTACNSGQPYYVRGRNVNGEIHGLQGNLAYSVAVNTDGKVWIGHASDSKTGRGIGILQHNGTFGDSSGGNNAGAGSDDLWSYLQVDGVEGSSDAIVTALELSGDIKLIGTKDNRNGDGFGIRAYDAGADRWTPLVTGRTGLPSNQVSGIAISPLDQSIWVNTAKRGIAHFDGNSWQAWRMFGAGRRVASITLDVRAGMGQLPVDIDTQEAFDAAFPGEGYLRIGSDPNFYRVTRYILPRSGLDGQIKITPPLAQKANQGDAVFTVIRGPASDEGTQVAVDAQGRAWAGGGESIWTGDACDPARAAAGQCWLDGGLGRYEGDGWSVFNIDNSPLEDNMILAVEVDSEGRVWAAMSNAIASGYGIGIYDPASDSWTLVNRASLPSGQRLGSNGITDLALDPETGDVWASHHSVVEWVQNIGGNWDRIFLGGGVSRWSKAENRWSTWGKNAGATLRAHSSAGTGGEMTAVQIDRGRNRVWAGSWDSDDNFHWINGYGVHAAVNWCPLDACGPSDWQSVVWREDGKVSSMALDADDNLWVGTTRNGAGLVPPEGGVKLFDGSDWFTLTPHNADLASNRISALASDPGRQRMWVGTQNAGISVFDAAAEAPTATPEPSATSVATSTGEATPTPDGSRTATVTATRTSAPPSATRTRATPGDDCPPIRLFLPMMLRSRGVPPDPLAPSVPRPELRGPCPEPSATPTPSRTASATFVVPSSTPEATMPADTATPEPGVTASPTPPRPTAQPSATPLGASATPSASPSPSATATESALTATPRVPPLGAWSVFSPPDVRVPSVAFNAVAATGPTDVWFVGDAGNVLHWDGAQLTSVSANSQSNLRSIAMLAPDRGYIAGDGGTLLQLRSRRWSKANTGSYTDNWASVSAFDGSDGVVAWVVGAGSGNRLKLTDSEWAPPGPADRNTGHTYSAVDVVGESLAYAIQGGTSGGRIYSWSGDEWRPGISTGPLFGLDVPASALGLAVGPRGAVWWIDDEGKWARMPSQPSTSGEDLLAAAIVTHDRAFAGGGRAGLFHWNGAGWTKLTIAGATRNRGIRGMWMAPDGSEGWAVGEDGLILHYQ